MISAVDADDIYKIPMLLHEQALDDIVIDKLRVDAPPADLSEWRQVVNAQASTPTGRPTSRWSASTCRSAIPISPSTKP